MGSLFGSPNTDAAPIAAPVAPAIDPVVQQQEQDASTARRLSLMSKGRSSTNLTGGLGDTSTPMTASKSLLGS